MAKYRAQLNYEAEDVVAGFVNTVREGRVRIENPSSGDYVNVYMAKHHVSNAGGTGVVQFKIPKSIAGGIVNPPTDLGLCVIHPTVHKMCGGTSESIGHIHRHNGIFFSLQKFSDNEYWFNVQTDFELTVDGVTAAALNPKGHLVHMVNAVGVTLDTSTGSGIIDSTNQVLYGPVSAACDIVVGTAMNQHKGLWHTQSIGHERVSVGGSMANVVWFPMSPVGSSERCLKVVMGNDTGDYAAWGENTRAEQLADPSRYFQWVMRVKEGDESHEVPPSPNEIPGGSGAGTGTLHADRYYWKIVDRKNTVPGGQDAIYQGYGGTYYIRLYKSEFSVATGWYGDWTLVNTWNGVHGYRPQTVSSYTMVEVDALEVVSRGIRSAVLMQGSYVFDQWEHTFNGMPEILIQDYGIQNYIMSFDISAFDWLRDESTIVSYVVPKSDFPDGIESMKNFSIYYVRSEGHLARFSDDHRPYQAGEPQIGTIAFRLDYLGSVSTSRPPILQIYRSKTNANGEFDWDSDMGTYSFITGGQLHTAAGSRAVLAGLYSAPYLDPHTPLFDPTYGAAIGGLPSHGFDLRQDYATSVEPYHVTSGYNEGGFQNLLENSPGAFYNPSEQVAFTGEHPISLRRFYGTETSMSALMTTVYRFGRRELYPGYYNPGDIQWDIKINTGEVREYRIVFHGSTQTITLQRGNAGTPMVTVYPNAGDNNPVSVDFNGKKPVSVGVYLVADIPRVFIKTDSTVAYGEDPNPVGAGDKIFQINVDVSMPNSDWYKREGILMRGVYIGTPSDVIPAMNLARAYTLDLTTINSDPVTGIPTHSYSASATKVMVGGGGPNSDMRLYVPTGFFVGNATIPGVTVCTAASGFIITELWKYVTHGSLQAVVVDNTNTNDIPSLINNQRGYMTIVIGSATTAILRWKQGSTGTLREIPLTVTTDTYNTPDTLDDVPVGRRIPLSSEISMKPSCQISDIEQGSTTVPDTSSKLVYDVELSPNGWSLRYACEELSTTNSSKYEGQIPLLINNFPSAAVRTEFNEDVSNFTRVVFTSPGDFIPAGNVATDSLFVEFIDFSAALVSWNHPVAGGVVERRQATSSPVIIANNAARDEVNRDNGSGIVPYADCMDAPPAEGNVSMPLVKSTISEIGGVYTHPADQIRWEVVGNEVHVYYPSAWSTGVPGTGMIKMMFLRTSSIETILSGMQTINVLFGPNVTMNPTPGTVNVIIKHNPSRIETFTVLDGAVVGQLHSATSSTPIDRVASADPHSLTFPGETLMSIRNGRPEHSMPVSHSAIVTPSDPTVCGMSISPLYVTVPTIFVNDRADNKHRLLFQFSLRGGITTEDVEAIDFVCCRFAQSDLTIPADLLPSNTNRAVILRVNHWQPVIFMPDGSGGYVRQSARGFAYTADGLTTSTYLIDAVPCSGAVLCGEGDPVTIPDEYKISVLEEDAHQGTVSLDGIPNSNYTSGYIRTQSDGTSGYTVAGGSYAAASYEVNDLSAGSDESVAMSFDLHMDGDFTSGDTYVWAILHQGTLSHPSVSSSGIPVLSSSDVAVRLPAVDGQVTIINGSQQVLPQTVVAPFSQPERHPVSPYGYVGGARHITIKLAKVGGNTRVFVYENKDLRAYTTGLNEPQWQWKSKFTGLLTSRSSRSSTAIFKSIKHGSGGTHYGCLDSPDAGTYIGSDGCGSHTMTVVSHAQLPYEGSEQTIYETPDRVSSTSILLRLSNASDSSSTVILKTKNGNADSLEFMTKIIPPMGSVSIRGIIINTGQRLLLQASNNRTAVRYVATEESL